MTFTQILDLIDEVAAEKLLAEVVNPDDIFVTKWRALMDDAHETMACPEAIVDSVSCV